MSDSESIDSAGRCVVCGKDTTGGRGFMTLQVDARAVPLCCPMCYKIYQEDPARYLAALRARDISRRAGWDSKW